MIAKTAMMMMSAAFIGGGVESVATCDATGSAGSSLGEALPGVTFVPEGLAIELVVRLCPDGDGPWLPGLG
jgi:hypothetical protein